MHYVSDHAFRLGATRPRRGKAEKTHMIRAMVLPVFAIRRHPVRNRIMPSQFQYLEHTYTRIQPATTQPRHAAHLSKAIGWEQMF